MHTRGVLAPETPAEASEEYESLGPAAQTVTREVAKAMSFDREEYRERVTGEVVATARDAMFASLLRVHVGTREEFEAWRDDHPDLDVIENGSENVDRVVWHVVPFEDTVVTATFQDESDAAVGTLQRIVHGRFYNEVV